MPATKKRPGPPKKAAHEKMDYPISVWLTADLRERLQIEADKKGPRQLSGEITQRLKDSFAIDEEREGLMKAFGGREIYALLRILSLALDDLELGADRRWYDDRDLHDAATKIARLLFLKLKPAGEARKASGWIAGVPKARRARVLLKQIILKIATADASNTPLAREGRLVVHTDLHRLAPYLREWLGPLFDRLYPSKTGSKS